MEERFRYDEQGTLAPPGPIGRVIRLIFGLACGYALYELIAHGSGLITRQDLNDHAWWPMILIALYVFPDVLNIGFGIKWNRETIYGILLMTMGSAAIAAWAFWGSPLGPPLGLAIYVWLFYTFAHLGFAFLLAALIATPGCEMRSIPHAWSLISGKQTREHYCPGFITPLDRWETKAGEPRS